MTKTLSDNEKRHFLRVPFISNVQMTLDENAWECRLLDISLKGLLIEPPPAFAAIEDALYYVNLKLSEDVAIDMQAKIMHLEPNSMGLQWVNIDLESFSTLRYLLEHNLNDPDEVNRELAELVKND